MKVQKDPGFNACGGKRKKPPDVNGKEEKENDDREQKGPLHLQKNTS